MDFLLPHQTGIAFKDQDPKWAAGCDLVFIAGDEQIEAHAATPLEVMAR